jgi:hypothetical protein
MEGSRVYEEREEGWGREREREVREGWWWCLSLCGGVCFGARALGMEAEVDALGGEGRWSNIKRAERVQSAVQRAALSIQ